MSRITAVLLLWASACSGPSGSTETTLPVGRDQVVEAFKKVVADEGYKIQEEDPAAGTVETHWQNTMAMTWTDGSRRRAILKAAAAPDGRATDVSIQVPLEVNQEMRAPLDPVKASWEPGGRDADSEALLLMRMRMKLGLLRLE